MNVFQTITAVKRDLGAVDKNGKMTAGPAKYNYRSIDDVINALHDPLSTHGLVIAPKLRSIEQVYGQGNNGNQTRTVVEFEWTIAGPEGDSFTAATSGEAMDTQDKGSNKAGTAAYKQLLTQLLAIPFQTEDPDDFHPDTEASKPTVSKPAAPQAGPVKESTGSSAPSPAPSATPKSEPGQKSCAVCTYAIGPKDSVKKAPGGWRHADCLVDDNNISSILDNFGS